MLNKIVFFAAAFMAVGAIQYPPGVDPVLCPNYPYCGVIRQAKAYVPLPYSVPGYPANVNPAACPNYPYCSEVVAPSVPTYVPQLPADVDPTFCPNYPYCDVSYTSYRNA